MSSVDAEVYTALVRDILSLVVLPALPPPMSPLPHPGEETRVSSPAADLNATAPVGHGFLGALRAQIPTAESSCEGGNANRERSSPAAPSSCDDPHTGNADTEGGTPGGDTAGVGDDTGGFVLVG